MQAPARWQQRPVLAQPLSGIPDLLAQVYARRGVQSLDELNASLKSLLPAQALAGLPAAIELLQDALQKQQRILIVGDFDADGATSTAVCLRALRSFGALFVDYLVPNRFTFGYGLTPGIVELAIQQKQPELIITVDNGIASHEGVAAAHTAGVRVLITDHHLPGQTLPPADAIVNPNQLGCGFASKSLAGVGVVFYVMTALRSRLRESGWFAQQQLPEPNMAQLLDLVALGTVADVVSFDANNRRLVQQGLARIRAGHCCAGISALLAVSGRAPEQLVASDLGFAIGPRLNAAGRLDDMSLGIECLLTDNQDRAQQLATELDALNVARREIEAGMQQEAMSALQAINLRDDRLESGLVLYDRHWHQGVVGLLAGRIKERFHRPTIVFAPADSVPFDVMPQELKGSARSIPGVHIRDILDAVATRHPGLITKFGGHSMAAGLSIPAANLPAFRQAFADMITELSAPEVFESVLLTDGELAANQLTEQNARLLREAGPWGQNFPEPLFEGEFLCLDQRLLKEKHIKFSLGLPDSNRIIDAIAFNVDRQQWPKPGCQRLRLAYRLDINSFRGLETVQLRIEAMRAL